jgi:hypothetical protein
VAVRFAAILGFAYLAVAVLAFGLYLWSRSRGHPHEYEAMGAAVLFAATLPFGPLFLFAWRALRRGKGRWPALALNVVALLPAAFLLVKALPHWKQAWEIAVLNSGLLAFVALHLCAIVTLCLMRREDRR